MDRKSVVRRRPLGVARLRAKERTMFRAPSIVFSPHLISPLSRISFQADVVLLPSLTTSMETFQLGRVACTSSSSSATTAAGLNKHKPIIILLDQASLETVKNKRDVYELLNCDDHRNICRKRLHKDPNVYRPDILHQELLAIFDSPLHKAGLVKVYVLTQKGVLIDVHPSLRIPRTYARFAGLFCQLLHKFKIKADTESTVLLKVIKNPFSQYLPAGTRVYGMEPQGTLYSPVCLARAILPAQPPPAAVPNPSPPPPVCFIVGATASENVQLSRHAYIQDMVSLSRYPLSGAAALSRLLYGVEQHWGIV